MDLSARILASTILTVRRRCEGVAGAEVLERDGLVLSLTNVPEPSLNSAFVEREPSDPVGALGWAEEEMASRGHTFGVEYPPGRWPALDRAIVERGLERLFARPVMGVPLASLPEPDPATRITVVRSMEDALVLARVDAEAFGTPLEISERVFAPNLVGVEGSRGFVAWLGDEPVGTAVAQAGVGATGVFGVGVVPSARRRGIGRALTLTAARAFTADLAWLLPTEMGRPLYERLGFRDLETWEVWVRRS